MDSFLICGLPRSRLAWLSRFLSVPNHSVCFCNGLSLGTSAANFWMFSEMCWARSVAYFGNAEVLNLVVLPSLLAARPLTKVIWIDRGVSESIKSAADSGLRLDPHLWQAMLELRDRYRDHYDLVVPFGKLDDEGAVRSIWHTVLPGVPFNRRRWKAFAGRRIVCERELAHAGDFSRLQQFLRTEAETISVPPL